VESSGSWIFLDRGRQPLSARAQEALRNVLPQLRNQFRSPNNDELLVVEILEEAGSRVEDHERAYGEVENVDAYAWITVQNGAKSRLRRWSLRLFRAMLSSSESEAVLETLPAQFGSAEQIECDVENKEIRMQLTVPEQHLLANKTLGLSSREIAQEERMSIVSANTHLYRIKRKIRALQESGPDASLPGRLSPRSRGRHDVPAIGPVWSRDSMTSSRRDDALPKLKPAPHRTSCVCVWLPYHRLEPSNRIHG